MEFIIQNILLLMKDIMMQIVFRILVTQNKLLVKNYYFTIYHKVEIVILDIANVEA